MERATTRTPLASRTRGGDLLPTAAVGGKRSRGRGRGSLFFSGTTLSRIQSASPALHRGQVKRTRREKSRADAKHGAWTPTPARPKPLRRRRPVHASLSKSARGRGRPRSGVLAGNTGIEGASIPAGPERRRPAGRCFVQQNLLRPIVPAEHRRSGPFVFPGFYPVGFGAGL